jgi:hypothetical protein
MIAMKTPMGQQVLKDRSVKLTPRQRAALILIDGKRSLSEVLQATAAAGVCRDDVDCLFQLALVAPGAPAVEAAAPQAAEPATGISSGISTRTTTGTAAEPQPADVARQRYAAAYPLASQLAASLGLRGVRLSLAVEGARSLEELIAVSARLRDAVGREKFAPLEAALGQA